MASKSPLVPILALASAAWLGACRPPASQVELRLGVEASRAGRWDEAVARWTKAAASDPASAAAHNNLAVAFESLGRFEEAGAEYETALRLAPADAQILENYRRFKEARQAASRPAEPDKAGGPRGER